MPTEKTSIGKTFTVKTKVTSYPQFEWEWEDFGWLLRIMKKTFSFARVCKFEKMKIKNVFQGPGKCHWKILAIKILNILHLCSRITSYTLWNVVRREYGTTSNLNSKNYSTITKGHLFSLALTLWQWQGIYGQKAHF